MPAVKPRIVTDREEGIVAARLRKFAQMQRGRDVFGAHWEEVAELIDPTSRNTFFFANRNTPGEKKTDKQIDATGMMALHRFAAICDSLLTPRNMTWLGLRASNDYLMKNRDVRLWYEDTTRKLFAYRYAPLANFSAQNQSVYRNLGAYGTGPLFIDALDGRLSGSRGIRYKALPIGEVFYEENHQGLIDGFIRWFRYTARQIQQAWPDTFPEILRPALENDSVELFDLIHCVAPREDYDPDRLDVKGKPYASEYISLTGRVLLQEGGYNSFPLPCGRYDQTPGEVYGRSPAMMVLPALKTLNAEKRVFLTQGHRAASPVLLTADDGVVDMSMRPGAMNKGGVTADGKLLVHALPTGDIQISKEMMQEEKMLINDAFLVSLFQILTESPQMTATEVIERTNEKGILIAPTMGRQQSEYLGAAIPREIDVLAMQNLLEPMPPALKEANGEYAIVYTSPLSRAMRAGEASGFLRSVQQAMDMVKMTGDPSYMDPYDYDTAAPDMADINGVPPSWMASDDKIAAKRKGRADAQKRQEQIQAAPAAAAMMKAQKQPDESGQQQQGVM